MDKLMALSIIEGRFTSPNHAVTLGQSPPICLDNLPIPQGRSDLPFGFWAAFLSLLSGIDILDALSLTLEVEAFPAVVLALVPLCGAQHDGRTVDHNLPNPKLVNGSSKK